MQFFHTIHDLALSTVVRENTWIYAPIQSLHAIGMGLLVGTITVISLRLLGLFPRISPNTLINLVGVTWAGLFFNAGSGLLMFMADAPRMSVNRLFLTKMAFIVCGIALFVALRRTLLNDGANWSRDGVIPLNARVLAGASLLVWYAAIAFGRLTAYFQ